MTKSPAPLAPRSTFNLGGGMHHAHAADGGGWCVYDDICLAIRAVRRAAPGRVRRVVVVDLDAHQGNGVARDVRLDPTLHPPHSTLTSS